VTAGFAGYLARRFALLVFTLILVPSLSFVFFQLLEQDIPDPGTILRELVDYLGATFLHADVGAGAFRSDTFIRTRGAFDVIADGFLVDVALLGGALVAGVLAGLLAGTVQAMHPHSALSRVIAVATAFVLSSPVYWLGLIVLLFFAPGVGSVAQIPFLSTIGGYRGPGQDPVAFVQSLWLPCLIVSAPLAAACTRMCAGQLGGVMEEDFVRTARGKGLRQRRIIRRHALPVASAPVVALVGVNMNLVLTNAALVETVFNLPGGFRYMERALINRDVDLVQALILEATFFIVVANFLADAVLAWIDPRVRESV
jgi:ABC-type dipeptide/oligopeptide/nickel transport system permease component